jgi:hypothetical protein
VSSCEQPEIRTTPKLMSTRMPSKHVHCPPFIRSTKARPTHVGSRKQPLTTKQDETMETMPRRQAPSNSPAKEPSRSACQLGLYTQTKHQHFDKHSTSTNFLHLPGLVFTTGTSSYSTIGTSC